MIKNIRNSRAIYGCSDGGPLAYEQRCNTVQGFHIGVET